MKETIRELFYGNIFPSERCGNNNTEIKALTKRLCEGRGKLCNSLSNEQKELLEQYDDLIGEMYSLYNEEFFVYGFSLGAKIIKESLDKE